MDANSLDYVNALIDSRALEGELRLGNQTCTVSDVSLTCRRHTDIATWADICKPTVNHKVTMLFETLTAINKKNGQGQRFAPLYPESKDVFFSLYRRWQGLGGPELPTALEAYLNDNSCVVSNHTLRTISFKTRERTQIGFTGRVHYMCMKSDEKCVTAMNWLARLAFYTGIGYQTARGMGAVRVWFQK